MCVQQKRTVKDEKRLQHQTDAYYLRSPAEMNELFKHWPQAMENAARIGELCNVTFDLGKNTYLPKFKVPEGYDRRELRGRAGPRRGCARASRPSPSWAPSSTPTSTRRGWRWSWGSSRRWSSPATSSSSRTSSTTPRSTASRSGPGRGSGAGSLVAYALRITDIDPIANKLLFERFLNPERVSLPDFDVDFCMNRRDEVIQLRHRQVRQGQRRADRHHAPDEGPQLHPRRGPGHGHPRGRRQPGGHAWCPSRSRASRRPSPRPSSRSRA